MLKKGFTIIELLIVICVIGILATFVIISYIGIANKAIAASLKVDLKNNVNLLKLYHVENDVYPSAVDETSKCPTAPYPDDKYCLKTSSDSILTYDGGDQHFTMTNSKNGMTYMVSEGFEEPFLVTPITAIANISGATQNGHTLTAGAITPSGATVSYRWQSSTTVDGTYTHIPGATSNTYTLTSAEVGKYIKVVATGIGNYYGSVTSDASDIVTKMPITAIANISGTTQNGHTLTAGAITPSGATASYQWQSSTTADGTYTNISGATSSTYILVFGDVGKYIKVVATGTGDYTGNVTSAASAQVTDPNWIAVGTQVWAKYNMNVGTRINGTTNQTNNGILEKYCTYDNESNCTTYGALYRWGEAMQYSEAERAQGICPAGSHIPNDTDWTVLTTSLGGESVAGAKMRTGGSSGLNIPHAGNRKTDGSFSGLSTHSWLFSSSTSWIRILFSYENFVNRSYTGGDVGFSVRCLKN